MATQTYLMNRNGIYYARIPVPLDLQKRVGRKEIWKSLGNRNYKDACTLLKSVLLSDVLLMVPQKEVLSLKPFMIAIGERQREVSRHRLCHLYLTTHQSYSKAGLDEVREADVEVFVYDAKEELATYYEDLKITDFRSYEEILATRLQTTKFQAPDKTSIHYIPAMTQLVKGLIRGTEEAIKGIETGAYLDFIDGMVKPYPDAMLETKSKSSMAREPKQSSVDNGITLKQLTEQFNNSQEIQDRSEAVRTKYATYQALLCEVLGNDTAVKIITRPFVREKLIPILKHLPSNFLKKPEYKGMSATQVAIAEQSNPSEHPKLSPVSRNDYLEHLALIMKWADAEGYDATNPTVGLMFKDEIKAKDKRDSFTVEQVNLIFSDSKIMAARKATIKGHQFWVPFISLCTGMRISEVLLLALEDVKQQGGIYYFDLHEREGRSLKTLTSIRKVPIPETVLKAGFHRYFESISLGQKDKSSSTILSMLFPYVTVGKHRPGDPLSKWFSRKLKDLGIKSKTLSFHSLRHTFKDFITDASLPPSERQVALSMCGWESSEVHARYGSKDYSLSVGKEVIDKVELTGVDMAHIKGRS